MPTSEGHFAMVYVLLSVAYRSDYQRRSSCSDPNFEGAYVWASLASLSFVRLYQGASAHACVLQRPFPAPSVIV